MKKRRRKGVGKDFWNSEYKTSEYLALSTNPSSDLQKFMRWIERNTPNNKYETITDVLDLGCGNGRNLIYLAKEFGLSGVGIDISREAIEQAEKASMNLDIIYHTQSISETIPLPDNSKTLIIDMMTSHFLNKSERSFLLTEIIRVLKPGGWFYFKTFLLDNDEHAMRLIKESPAQEMGSYIHPHIGVAEHIFTEQEIQETLYDEFFIHKITKSHKHRLKGKAAKRRSISVYAQKTG